MQNTRSAKTKAELVSSLEALDRYTNTLYSRTCTLGDALNQVQKMLLEEQKELEMRLDRNRRLMKLAKTGDLFSDLSKPE